VEITVLNSTALTDGGSITPISDEPELAGAAAWTGDCLMW